MPESETDFRFILRKKIKYKLNQIAVSPLEKSALTTFKITEGTQGVGKLSLPYKKAVFFFIFFL